MNHQREIKESLIALATITGKELSAIALNAYMDALSDLDGAEILISLKDWLRTSRGFPYPSDIREKIKPQISADDDAQYVSNMIIKSIAMDGYTNTQRAKERIGELGWAVVDASGGWSHLCQTLTNENETIFRAQLRELCKTIYRRAKAGYLDDKPSLPGRTEKSEIHSIIGNAMKGIE